MMNKVLCFKVLMVVMVTISIASCYPDPYPYPEPAYNGNIIILILLCIANNYTVLYRNAGWSYPARTTSKCGTIRYFTCHHYSIVRYVIITYLPTLFYRAF